MITLVLADDHHVLRKGLVGLLSMENAFQVVGEAGTGEELLTLVERARPQVALVDVRMPGMGGIAAARQIGTSWPEVGVVLLTMHDEDDYVFDGITAGARAYLPKECEHEVLVRTVREVGSGGAYLPPAVLKKVMNKFRYLRERQPNLTPMECELLSRRELDVLGWVVRGYSNKQIARELSIDETTVKTHLHRIFEKLDVRDRTQAAVLAMRRGWFPAQAA